MSFEMLQKDKSFRAYLIEPWERGFHGKLPKKKTLNRVDQYNLKNRAKIENSLRI
jgi:hypothetical protein